MEDLLGAGAIIHHLSGSCSPEARLAKDAYMQYADSIFDVIAQTSSAKELREMGFENDVELACQQDVSHAVPCLIGQAYQNLQE